jgi:pimeloyl-ACP methyl ester carboxylesterase
MQDYGGPVGFRMAVAYPERIEALIVRESALRGRKSDGLENPRREHEGLSPGALSVDAGARFRGRDCDVLRKKFCRLD